MLEQTATDFGLLDIRVPIGVRISASNVLSPSDRPLGKRKITPLDGASVCAGGARGGNRVAVRIVDGAQTISHDTISFDIG